MADGGPWWSAPLDRDAQLLLLDQRSLGTTPPPDPSNGEATLGAPKKTGW